tara:strand:+ start:312 stop:2633 length:2322 start_codon:yes stop_codon:yes gene_type:complete
MPSKSKSKKRKSPRRKSPAVKLRKWFLRLSFLFLSLLLLFIASVYLGFWGPIPDSDELKAIRQSKSTLVYSQDKALIGSFYAVNRDPVSFDQLPEHLVQALVATEDERFYEHSGIDFLSLLRVVVKTLLMGDSSSGGGSTLTQQLAKNLFGRPDFGALSMPVNKCREMIISQRLESIYSKDEILALYLNTVSFSENTYGIAAGSQRFFNCAPKDLRIEEAAVLIGLLKANTTYNPRLHPEKSRLRRNVVLSQMQRNDYLKAEQLDSLQALPLDLDYSNLDLEGPAPYYLKQVELELKQILADKLKENGQPWDAQKDGLRVYTSLNADQQSGLRDAFRSHLANWQKKFDQHWSTKDPWSQKPAFFEKKLMASPAWKSYAAKGLSDDEIREKLSQKHSMELYHPAGNMEIEASGIDSLKHYLRLLRGASVLLDPQSGAVRAWVAGPDYRYLPYDNVNAAHTMASTVKPFVLSAALEAGEDPCEYQSAERREYPGYDDWSPRNYDGNYEGMYSMQGALKKSINTVTVAWYFKAGADKVRALAHKMGIADHWADGPSVSLGASAVSPIDLARAYALFANRGMEVEPYFIEKIETASGELLYHHEKKPAKRILKEETAQLMNAMLQGVSESGTARSLHSVYGARKSWAAKTGTSQNYSDAWFVAYRPDLVSVTWMGGINPLIRFRSGALGSGSTMALPVFGKLISKMESRITSINWPALSESQKEMLACPDYKEESLLDDLRSIFKKKEGKAVKEEEPEPIKEEKEGSWWGKIFKKKD